MITIVECRMAAAQKLKQADSNPQRRQGLTASADRWLLLAEQINEMDTATTQLRVTVTDDMKNSAMNHRGYDYSVLQTASPAGWIWTVKLDHKRTKTGGSYRREFAERAAILAIDAALKSAERVVSALSSLAIHDVRNLITEIETTTSKPTQ